MQRVIALIDGFNLYYGVRASQGHQHLWLDLDAVARRLLLPGQSLERVYYFTARVRNDPEAEQRQADYLAALGTRPSILVIEGRFQKKSRRCDICGDVRPDYEEKESDVNLAVTLVKLAATGACDVALVVSADSDLVPGVKAARELNRSLRTVAIFPPQRNSEDLKRSVHGWKKLGPDVIRSSQFPEKVTSREGVLTRPAKWR